MPPAVSEEHDDEFRKIPISEEADDELFLQAVFGNPDKVKAALKSRVTQLHPDSIKAASALQTPIDHLLNIDAKNLTDNLERFEAAVRCLPLRKKGERFMWVKQMNLTGRLARLLDIGDLFDQMSGIKRMSENQLETVAKEFGKEVADILKERKKELISNPTKEKDMQEIMGKFDSSGKFGDAEMFKEGLENQLGPADPFILKAIFREHMPIKNSDRVITGNYKIPVDSTLELARVLGTNDAEAYLFQLARDSKKDPENTKGPAEAELRDLRFEFRKLREIHSAIEIGPGYFPGDVGYVQKSLEFEFEVEMADSELQNVLRKIEEQFDPLKNPGSLLIENMKDSRRKTFTLYAPISFYQSGKHRSILIDECNLKATSNEHIYFYYEHIQNKASNDTLLDFLDNKLRTFEVGALREIYGTDAPSDKQVIIDEILKNFRTEILENQTNDMSKSSAIKFWKNRISLLPGRRNMTLRELMQVDIVRSANLRVEEAIQAYQYTGAMYEVIYLQFAF